MCSCGAQKKAKARQPKAQLAKGDLRETGKVVVLFLFERLQRLD
jgi:hypothetical protein